MSVVGIDLGTTNTVIACVRAGKVHVLADEQGARLLPSVVSFHPNGEVLVGRNAKARRVIDPRSTVYSHKRLIGRSWGSPEIAQARQRFPFELREGPGQGPLVHARGQDYTLPEISAFVLKRARQIAETALGSPVERAVITVPAHFNELQRASTKVAGRVSGLEVLRILNEPTAAALAYGLGRTGNERVAVYDLGGGTFDCTLLDLNGNVFEVLATAGDSFLGGDDVDTIIAERMAEAFLKAHRQDPKGDPTQLEKLKTSAEEMKIALSTAETHTVVLEDFGFAGGGSSVHFTFTMTRRDLEAAIAPLVDRTFKVTQDALALARLTPTSFDKVILVGGSTRIPLVRKRVEAFFGAPPMDRVNPDEVVAIGAAIQAAALTEGQRKRSIPSPPAAAPRRVPGVQSEVGDATHAGELKTESGGAAGPVSAVPSTIGGAPPSPGVSGARQASSALRTRRKLTSPGVAPASSELAAPTERAMRRHTLTGTGGADAPTLTATMQAHGEGADSAKPFGAPHDAPPLHSPPSANLPTLTGAGATAPLPSSGGEASGHLPSGPFGEIHDLSLVASSATAPSTDAASGRLGAFGNPLEPPTPQAAGAPAGSLPKSSATVDFGHVSDLSLISSSSETAAMDALSKARQQALDRGQFDDGDETAAMRASDPGDHAVETASFVPTTARMPEADRAPPARPRSEMTGKPAPPLIAPQPFAPTERRGTEPQEPPSPAPRTASMSAKPPTPQTLASARPGPPPLVQTAPSPQSPSAPPRQAALRSAPPPLAHTAPLGSARPAPIASAPPAPPSFGQGSALASAPPPGLRASPSEPPIFGAFHSSPPGPVMGRAAPGPPPPGFDPRPPVPPAAPRGLGYAAPVLVDVTPRGLVVETAGGFTDTIIPRNSKIPCERTRRFATGRDMQTSVRVRVAQGEHVSFSENTYLGEVELSGLRPAPRGDVVVAVTFECDADGTLRVRARDVRTGLEARATIQLVGVADESSVIMMMNRFAQQPVTGGGPGRPQ